MKEKMTEREQCEYIIKKDGFCNGLKCSKCPLIQSGKYSCDTECDESMRQAKQWLKDNPEPKLVLDIKRNGEGDYTIQLKQRTEEPPKGLTRREWLLKRVKEVEANKKEFNETADKAIEKLHKEMCCDGCYVQEDGKYKMHEHKIDQLTAVKIAAFINNMEEKHK